MCKSIHHSENQRCQYDFGETVRSEFSYIKSYDFRCTKEETNFVRYESDTAFLNIYHGLSSYEIGAEVGQLGIYSEPKAFSVSEIIRLSSAEEAENYRNYTATTPGAVIAGIKRLNEILKKYAEPCLMGNVGIFYKLAEQQKQWSKKFAMEVLSKQVRPKAIEAFRDKRYGEAVLLYESIESELSSSEYKKLEYSRKHL